MIISAQFEQSGFYDWIAQRITGAANNPKSLLAAVIGATGLLSAVFTNDVVVFALTPLLCAGILALKLDARPYLMALAASANAGSAATLIGNPQNILIGQSGKLDFSSYTLVALPPTLLALGIIFVVIVLTWRLEPATLSSDAAPVTLDRFQFGKALLAVVGLVVLFLTPLPREVSALAIAGLLLLSRRLSSRDMIGAVDWHLLLLFTCLFGITEAFSRTGLAQDGLVWLEHLGLLSGADFPDGPGHAGCFQHDRQCSLRGAVHQAPAEHRQRRALRPCDALNLCGQPAAHRFHVQHHCG